VGETLYQDKKVCHYR